MEVGGERPFSSYVGSPRVEQRRRSEPEKVSPSFLFPWNCFSPCVIPEDTMEEGRKGEQTKEQEMGERRGKERERDPC